MDNLRYIRRTHGARRSFTAVPGIGGMLMGSTALVAAWIAGPTAPAPRWLAVVAGGGGGGAADRDRRRRVQIAARPHPAAFGPGRKFVAGFAPAMLAGALLTLVLFRAGLRGFLPGIWLLLYGAGVVSGGAASVRVVP